MQDTKLSGLVGRDIGYSLSPFLHEAEAAALGFDVHYQLIDAAKRQFGAPDLDALITNARRLGFSGLNVTQPYKEAVIPALDFVDPTARQLGAVNTIVFSELGSVGHNTDVYGFGAGLDQALDHPDFSRVVQFGAGGAGSATARALMERGCRRLDIVDPQGGRASRLVARLTELFPGADIASTEPDRVASALARSTGIVNATPIGSDAHPGSPVDLDSIPAGPWVADVLYAPRRSQLLAHAEMLGSPTVNGGLMLANQAIMSFQLIFGVAPDAARMLNHADQLLTLSAA